MIVITLIVIVSSFASILYINNDVDRKDSSRHYNAHTVINKYGLKDVSNANKTYVFNSPDTNGKNTSSNITLKYNYYSGTDNITAMEVNGYINGTLTHQAFLINGTKDNNTNLTVIPIYSKNNNYNITKINNTSSRGKNNATAITADSSSATPGVCVDLYATYGKGSGGRSLAFDQTTTEILLAIIGGGAGFLMKLGGPVGMLVGGIIVVGVSIIQILDYSGGLNGIYYYQANTWLSGVYSMGLNAPSTQVPSDLTNYETSIITLYKGNFYIPFN